MTKDKTTIKIDATDKKLGRLASEIAVHLQGKNLTSYRPNMVAPVQVEISNVDELDINPKKLEEKRYSSYSGYPGGLKKSKMAKVQQEKGNREILRRAVKGMLPKNKLQEPTLKNLIIN